MESLNKYKVVDKIRAPYKSFTKIDSDYLKWAQELSNQYGLSDHYTTTEIIKIWTDYSDDVYSASWLIPSRQTIEAAFGVILEELNE